MHWDEDDDENDYDRNGYDDSDDLSDFDDDEKY